MTQSFFEIEKGLELNSSVFLAGTGVPGGSGDPDAVGIGSFYLDTTAGAIYVKDTAGTGTNKWKEISTQEYVDGQIVTNTTWRAPADVLEDALTSLPAGTTNTVDGVTVFAGMRVLFTALTTSTDRNVWIASGSTSSWVWTEDTNSESDGDSIYTISGTHAGHTYVYNGTDWVHINSADETELGFLRTFVGKSGAGSETPTYSSNNYITDGDNLETAMGKLDVQVGTNATDIGTNQTDITTLQNEDAFIRTFVGKTASGSETPTYSSNNYISNGTSLETAIGALDTQVATNASGIATNVSDIAKARTEASQTNVTTQVTLDSVNVDSYAAVKWVVHAHGNLSGDAALKNTIEILATHDGHNVSGGADATDTDYSIYSKLKMGNITGLSYVVDVSGTAGAQVMNLKVSSTMAADVRSIREVVTH